MRLLAISDLHLRYPSNRQALEALPPHRDDWLILAGDIAETEELLHWALALLSERFARLLWVPGNHDLWTAPDRPKDLRGEAKYMRQVAICRHYGVLTPEDPYIRWPGPGPSCRLAPLFLLYDYSFRPPEVPEQDVLAWAAEEHILSADEALLHPDPHPSRAAWCAARCQASESRLEAAAREDPLVLINHFPLRYDLVRLKRIPRFSPWCGTRRTESWHLRYRALAVIHGHLHIRGTHFRDGVRCEEVSLGYPRDWDNRLPLAAYLREILPGPGSSAV
ncbi:MAG: metallophosphoesterase [Thermoanaerobaculia bacterium]